MTALRRLPVLTVLGIALLAATGAARADTYTISSSSYAAVAYSPKTDNRGIAYNYGSRYAAEQSALKLCKAEDAKIVGWVNFGWVVVAFGDDGIYGVGWEYGDGANSGDARRRAMEELEKRGGKLRTLLVVCSGDVDPKTYEFKK